MHVQLITIGDELLCGKTVDTNAAYVADRLARIGVEVIRMVTIGDSVEQIVEALRSVSGNVDAVIVTGGLGPTPDDLTRQAAATAFTKELAFSEDMFLEIEKRWAGRGKSVPSSARRLALIPDGAEPIENAVGAAAGLKVSFEGTVYLFLPGVPEEMRRMMEDSVLPFMMKKVKGRAIRHLTLRTAGITESALHGKLKGLAEHMGRVKIAYLPQTTEVHLRLTVQSNSVEKAEQEISEAERVVRNRLGYYIYGVADDSLEEVVADLLLDRKATISVAESCTGGLISGRLTDIPGSSKYFERGLTVYSERAKLDLLSIPAEVLEKHGTVSSATAVAMAEGIRDLVQTDLGLSVTGTMGPTGGTPEKPVGLVYVGLAHSTGTYHKEFRFVADRVTNKKLAAQAALNEVRLFLLKS